MRSLVAREPKDAAGSDLGRSTLRPYCAQPSTSTLRLQEEAFKASRRDYRLLEELRKRRFAEWLQATNRELDQLASDLYLARWDCKPRG